MASIKGFITNLGKYNEGELVGEWIDFPISDDDLQAVLQRIGIGSVDEFGSPYEEIFFTDWELPSGMDWQIFGETPDIEQVNEVAELVDSSSYPEDVIGAVLDHYSPLEEGIQALRNQNFLYYPDAYDADSLGHYVVDDIDNGPENLDTEVLVRYFDYEAYGRDLETSGTIDYIDSGAIEFLN